MGGSTGIQRGRTLEEAFRRYEREVPVHEQRKRLKILRTAALGRTEVDGVKLSDMKLSDIWHEILS